MATQTLDEKLSMPHLRHKPAEVLAQIQNAAQMDDQAHPAEEAPATDPRHALVYTFAFRYQDGRGKVWTGSFTNKILSVGEKMTFGIIRARRLAGASLETVSASTYALISQVSWLELSLSRRPTWAQDLLSIHDEELVQAIWQQVDLHEITFFGRGAFAPAGQAES